MKQTAGSLIIARDALNAEIVAAHSKGGDASPRFRQISLTLKRFSDYNELLAMLKAEYRTCSSGRARSASSWRWCQVSSPIWRTIYKNRGIDLSGKTAAGLTLREIKSCWELAARSNSRDLQWKRAVSTEEEEGLGLHLHGLFYSVGDGYFRSWWETSDLGLEQ